MSQIAVRHEDGDRFAIDVRGHSVVVDQPGSGDSGPTPTELFVASLAACAGFYARRFLSRHGIGDGELVVTCDFTWTADHTRVASIAIRVQTPRPLDEALVAPLRRVIDQCTVHASIRTAPDVQVTLAARSELAEVAPAPLVAR